LIGISIRFKSDPGGGVATDCGRQKPDCLGMTKGKHRKPTRGHGVFSPCPTGDCPANPVAGISKAAGNVKRGGG
jgi:hypothetical protein